ncbi:MAG: ABC transporter ATP-binding protein [Acidimicrobiales bacterium]
MSLKDQAAGLALCDVTVRYGSTVAVDGLSLDVAAGETVAVIGPSGSGKSTLLRAIAGLEPLTGGVIEAGERSLEGVPAHQRDLGLMFQDHALFPHLTVADNVGFGLDMQGLAGSERERRISELLELVGLSTFGSRSVSKLSGGEAQRVALARAIAPRPALLMLDEPFGSLDRVLREQLTGDVRRLLDELGQTALHVTHDQAEAFALAERVAVLAEGRLQQLGTPEELWNRPASTFVAEFLGHPNRWTIDVAADGTARLGSFALGVVPSTKLPDDGRSGPLHAVVPITALSVASDDDNNLPIVVRSARFVDGRYRVEATIVDDADLAIVFESRGLMRSGDRAHLAVAIDQLHVLSNP